MTRARLFPLCLAMPLALALLAPVAPIRAQNVAGEAGFTLTMPFSAQISGREFGSKSFHFMDIEGVTFNQTGGGFLHRAHLVCNAVNDTGSIYGYCEATDPQGSRVIIIVQRLTEPDRLSGEGGELIFINGTGDFAGIVGGGTYTIDYATDPGGAAHGMVTMEGQYNLP